LKILELINQNTQALKKSGIKEYNLESELILMHILNLEKAELISNLNQNLNVEEIKKNNKIIDKRIKRIPLPYILKKIHFFGLPFYINKNVLIPRQETELIIEITKKLALDHKNPNFQTLEIGSGSGVISIAIANELNNKKNKYILTDISDKALQISLTNIKQINKNKDTFHIVKTNLLNGIKGKYKFIISNPPYLSKIQMELLSPELQFEPQNALYGGKKGYELSLKLLLKIKQKQIECEYIILEINSETYMEFFNLTNDIFNNQNIYLIKDYTQNYRFIIVSTKNIDNKLNEYCYFRN
tara:strand:+ start:4666 stop:5565 length:900 start_codon:yes stop_codon:yes gene_type:complete